MLSCLSRQRRSHRANTPPPCAGCRSYTDILPDSMVAGCTMQRLSHILPIILAGNVFAGPFPGQPIYVGSRSVVLSCESANRAEINRIHVWVSTDDGESWQEAAVTPGGASTARFEAEDDGNYGFYTILENRAGRSAAVPTAGSKPHLRVIVDTAPPTLQIHGARQTTSAEGEALLHLDVSLVDENLGDAGTRLFYRADADTGWQDAGPVNCAAAVVNWRLPPDIPARIDLRLAATDRAGNQAVDEILAVSIGSPATVPPQRTEARHDPGLEPVTVPEVEPVTVAPVRPVTLAHDVEPGRETQPSLRDVKRTELLHEQARRFISEGRFPLAGARLQEALELTPNDADLQVDLARVLYRTRQYDRAAHHYQLALEAYPDHLAAIEGLALVAVGQKRYPDARSHMQHLLRLCPESGEHWLHFGDVEHMLGNAADARAAWNQALQLEQADQSIRKEAQKRLELFGQK